MQIQDVIQTLRHARCIVGQDMALPSQIPRRPFRRPLNDPPMVRRTVLQPMYARVVGTSKVRHGRTEPRIEHPPARLLWHPELHISLRQPDDAVIDDRRVRTSLLNKLPNIREVPKQSGSRILEEETKVRVAAPQSPETSRP
jgi:hypothetical protein